MSQPEKHCGLCGLAITGGIVRHEEKDYHPLCASVLEVNRLEAINADLLGALEPLLSSYKAERETFVNSLAPHLRDVGITGELVADMDTRISAAEAAIAKGRAGK